MSFIHTHTITIRHPSGKLEKIAVDSGGRELRDLEPGATIPLHTREETLMELPADWVYSEERGLTYFGSPEGPFTNATYSVEREPEVSAPQAAAR